MDPYQNDQLEQAVAQVKRRTSSLCSTPSSPTTRSQSWSRPPTPQNEPPLTPPDTVLLGVWPYATDDQIDFYLDGYNIIYPNANVVPIRRGRQHHDAALEILTQACEKPAEKQLQMLLHLFGNDGAAHVVDLLRSFRTRTGQTLPIQAVIMDSIPATPVPSLADAIESPQRLLLLAYTLLWSVCASLLAFLTLGHSDTASEHLRSGLHDPGLVPSDARKVYIWAARDIMFSWKSSSSSKHARSPDAITGASDGDVCESYEYAVKRSRVDEKGRWTGNQERYWLGIESAWEGGGSL